MMILTIIIISALAAVLLYKFGRKEGARIKELEVKAKELENIRQYYYTHREPCTSYYASKQKRFEYGMVMHGFDSIMIGLMENHFDKNKK